MKNNLYQFKFYFALLTIFFCLALLGCSSMEGFYNKNTSQSQTREDLPDRLNKEKAKQVKIDNLLFEASQAWAKQDFDRLELIYQSLDAVDPGNSRALDGLKNVSLARQHLLALNEVKAMISEEDFDLDIAIQKTHKILVEQPGYLEAKKIYIGLLSQQQQKITDRLHKKLTYNKPVSLQFREVNLKIIFEALAKTTNVNFILDKDIPSEQKATIFVENTDFNQALNLLLESNQLYKKILNENTVLIYPNDPNRQREYKDVSVRVFKLEYADLKQTVSNLKSILNIKQIESDSRLNTILIKDSPEILSLAEKVILSLDLPDPEVMLEMEVLEVGRGKLQNLGINYPTSLSVNVPTNGLTLKQLKSINSSDMSVGGTPGFIFNANTSDVNLLANPRIRVRNKDTAKIHIGDKVPVFSANVSSTGVQVPTVQYIDVGLKLEAEPTISSSGDVSIKINLNVGSLGKSISSATNQGSSNAAVSSAYIISTRMASTQLRLHDGETQILAGLIDDQDRKNADKIPGLADFPILGRLFSSNKDEKSKTEIILLITPRIIKEHTSPEPGQNEFWIGIDGDSYKRLPTPINETNVPILPTPQINDQLKQDDKNQNINFQIR